MKKIKLLVVMILLFSLVNLSLAETVKIHSLVNDYANIIDDVHEQQLESVLKQIYDSKTAEYSVVTIKSLDGQDIESYSMNLAQGVLGDKEKNNGLLLLVSVDDRKYRFEVGRGLEAELNDAKAGRIGRRYLKPNFVDGNYGKGILEASLAVKSILLGNISSEYYVTDKPVDNVPDMSSIIWFILFLLFFVFPFIGAKRRKGDRYFNSAVGAMILFGGGRRGSGGFGGGGFGGGGFGGFGGGGFGGGGAGGGW